MDKRKLIPVFLVIILLLFWQRQKSSRIEGFVSLTGTTMGPIVYNIKYLDGDQKDYKQAVDSVLESFNQSLSTYIPQSEISQFNRDDSVRFSSPHFYPVLEMSERIYQMTNGGFDPTIGPLIEAWGFGPGKNRDPKSVNVDSLRAFIGFEKLTYDQSFVSKSQHELTLDFSAVAKGYAVDIVAVYLEAQGVTDYMVEIGGEVRCKGHNAEGKAWRIGIEDPTVEIQERDLFSTVILEDKALATSGNYRNFYEVDGKKYAHTISPFTGYPVEHSLLSVSVFADQCMVADAFATGFMVLGLEKSLEIASSIDSVDAYFIYADEEGKLQTASTEAIRKKIR